MKALVTGISGFVGAGLAKKLLEKGWEVHGIIRPSSNLWRLSEVKKEIHFHKGSITNEDFVKTVFQKIRPDAVFHLAVYGAYPSQKEVSVILNTSVLSTFFLLNVAKLSGVRVFVNSGSSSEYGTKEHPMREDEHIDPNSYYAVGKAAQTLLGRHFAKEEGLPVITLRLFSVYGPFEEPGRLVPNVVLNALHGKEISLADSLIARDFVYLDDVTDAYLLAAQKPELSGEVFNIGTGVQRTLKELADVVISKTNSHSPIVCGKYEKRSFDTHIWVADIHKARSLLGWEPRYNLNSGLKENISWFKKNSNLYHA